MSSSKRGNQERKVKERGAGMFDPEHIGNLHCQKRAGMERKLAVLARLTPASKLDFI